MYFCALKRKHIWKAHLTSFQPNRIFFVVDWLASLWHGGSTAGMSLSCLPLMVFTLATFTANHLVVRHILKLIPPLSFFPLLSPPQPLFLLPPCFSFDTLYCEGNLHSFHTFYFTLQVSSNCFTLSES